MLVRDFMSSNVLFVDPDASIVACARIMRDANIGVLPVCKGKDCRLEGIVTDRDLVVRSIAEEGTGQKPMRVHQIMSRKLVCCLDDQPAEVARRIMLDNDVRRLPVLDSDNNLVGIVSLNDLSETRLHAKPWRVIFHRTLLNSYGKRVNVPVATIYITGQDGKEAVEAAAIEEFELTNGGRGWRSIVDGYTVVDPHSEE